MGKGPAYRFVHADTTKLIKILHALNQLVITVQIHKICVFNTQQYVRI
jgi:hypothetical protein